MPDEPFAVDAGGTACILLHRGTFAAVGGWDERLFPAIFADAALALRFRSARFSFLIEPAVLAAGRERPAPPPPVADPAISAKDEARARAARAEIHEEFVPWLDARVAQLERELSDCHGHYRALRRARPPEGGGRERGDLRTIA